MRMSDRAEAAVTFLDDLAEQHDGLVYAMFSGGDDSLTAALVTARTKRFTGCVHLDTGIGIPETQEFVIETCRRMGWPPPRWYRRSNRRRSGRRAGRPRRSGAAPRRTSGRCGRFLTLV